MGGLKAASLWLGAEQGHLTPPVRLHECPSVTAKAMSAGAAPLHAFLWGKAEPSLLGALSLASFYPALNLLGAEGNY